MLFRSALFVSLVILALVFHVTNALAQSPGDGAYSGPIIDMHIHAYDESNPLYGFTHPPTLRGETYDGVSNAEELKEKTLVQFRKHRIVKAVVTSGELWLGDAPDAVLVANAGGASQDLREQHAIGKLQVLAEMAPFYDGIRADDPSQLPYFELAQELGIPVGFHIFPGGPNYGIHHLPELMGKTRTYNALPSQIEDVLVQFPELKIYVMHGGWPHVAEMKALMYAHPNLYVDVAVLNWILPQEELNAYLKSMIDAGFGNRIMYGSDQMIWPQLISEGIASINAADFLTLEQKEDIFYDNAAKFLGLDAEEVNEHKRRQAR
jgi:predicted TIM-barrel fold metal-dependent hydrolase